MTHPTTHPAQHFAPASLVLEAATLDPPTQAWPLHLPGHPVGLTRRLLVLTPNTAATYMRCIRREAATVRATKHTALLERGISQLQAVLTQQHQHDDQPDASRLILAQAPTNVSACARIRRPCAGMRAGESR